MQNSRIEKFIGAVSSLFILLFVYTAFNKLTDFTHFQSVLSHAPLMGEWATLTAWLLPLLELAVAALLFLPRTRLKGLLYSFILMLLFTGYIALMLLFATKLPCSCGGVLSSMSWKEHLVFNISFTLLAFTGWYAGRKTIQLSKEEVIHSV